MPLLTRNNKLVSCNNALAVHRNCCADSVTQCCAPRFIPPNPLPNVLITLIRQFPGDPPIVFVENALFGGRYEVNSNVGGVGPTNVIWRPIFPLVGTFADSLLINTLAAGCYGGFIGLSALTFNGGPFATLGGGPIVNCNPFLALNVTAIQGGVDTFIVLEQ